MEVNVTNSPSIRYVFNYDTIGLPRLNRSLGSYETLASRDENILSVVPKITHHIQDSINYNYRLAFVTSGGGHVSAHHVTTVGRRFSDRLKVGFALMTNCNLYSLRRNHFDGGLDAQSCAGVQYDGDGFVFRYYQGQRGFLSALRSFNGGRVAVGGKLFSGSNFGAAAEVGLRVSSSSSPSDCTHQLVATYNTAGLARFSYSAILSSTVAVAAAVNLRENFSTGNHNGDTVNTTGNHRLIRVDDVALGLSYTPSFAILKSLRAGLSYTAGCFVCVESCVNDYWYVDVTLVAGRSGATLFCFNIEMKDDDEEYKAELKAFYSKAIKQRPVFVVENHI